MKTLSVVIFCASPVKNKAFTGLLKTLGITNIHASCNDTGAATFTPPFQELDVVICDSFYSLDELNYFKRLCEHFPFFSIIESEKLEDSLKWGTDNLVTHYIKYHLGLYEDDLSKAKIHSLLKKALTLKDITQNNIYKADIAQEALNSLLHEHFNHQDALADLQTDSVTTYFQPQYCTQTKALTGIEVTATWGYPAPSKPGNHEPCPPEYTLHWNQFFTVLANATQLHRHTLNIDPTIIFTYIIDASLLKTKHFASNALETLKLRETPLNKIAFEVSGHIEIPMSLECIDNITTLMNSHIGLSLGNFGAGDSPFDILADMPFTQIKLDTTFALKNGSPKKNQIISSIVSLAKSLHLKVIANDVRTEKQFVQLQHLGVDAAQGNFFHAPMTGEKLLTLLLDMHMPR